MVIAINLLGIIVILFIISWFWWFKAKDKALAVEEVVTIYVENGIYTPNIIRVKKGAPLRIIFIRKDQSSCAEYVIFEDLEVSAQLPFDQPYEVIIQTQQTGEFEFTCQMGMYRGKLIIA